MYLLKLLHLMQLKPSEGLAERRTKVFQCFPIKIVWLEMELDVICLYMRCLANNNF